METTTPAKNRWIAGPLALALLGGTALYFGPAYFAATGAAFAAEGKIIPAPTKSLTEPQGEQVAIFAGGCFWGIEGIFDHVKGVTKSESGYAGGSQADADYETVSSGTTGHAEAVRVTYDPAQISYTQLLHIFFSVGLNPTEVNRQGPDTGPQYRSALFPQNAEQATAAKAYIAQLNIAKIWPRPIATRIETGPFFAAEAYHQDYLQNNPNSGYIRTFDAPKIAALKRLFPAVYR
jgi:peptide-methionine (S)-S-oxide reductase